MNDKAWEVPEKKTKSCSGIFFNSSGGRTFSGIFNTPICFNHSFGAWAYRNGSMHDNKKVEERSVMVKIVVVKAPKFLRGILKSIFKMKTDEY